MSSTHRGALRQPDDFYETPAWCVRAILPHVGDLANRSILEPGCGQGSIIQALPAGRILGVEIDESRAAQVRALGRGSVICADYLRMSPSKHQALPLAQAPGSLDSFDLAIGNPPFDLAMEFARATLARLVPGGKLFFLLRMAFLASGKRAEWMQANTPTINVLSSRPSFVMIVRCARPDVEGEKKRSKKQKGCGWQTSLPAGSERPRSCEACGAKVTITTSDSADYAWFEWTRPDAQGLVPPPTVRILSGSP